MSTGELQSRCRPAQCTQIVPCQLQTRALWCGDHDLELIRLSSVFPATLDSQPLQMQKRISEMFAPLLAVVQQRDTEAQRLQTASERNEALNKQAADEQKAESKDCSWLLSPYFMLVSGLRPTHTRLDNQATPTCSPKSPKRLPTQSGARGICKNFILSSLPPSLALLRASSFLFLALPLLSTLSVSVSLSHHLKQFLSTLSPTSVFLPLLHLCFCLRSLDIAFHSSLFVVPPSLTQCYISHSYCLCCCLSFLPLLCRPLFSLLSVSPLSLSVLCRSFSRFSFVVSDHFLPPSISLLLPLSYFSSTPPPFLIFICSYLLCPSIFFISPPSSCYILLSRPLSFLANKLEIS